MIFNEVKVHVYCMCSVKCVRCGFDEWCIKGVSIYSRALINTYMVFAHNVCARTHECTHTHTHTHTYTYTHIHSVVQCGCYTVHQDECILVKLSMIHFSVKVHTQLNSQGCLI